MAPYHRPMTETLIRGLYVSAWPLEDLLLPNLPQQRKRERDGDVWTQEVRLGSHVGHYFRPLAHHGVAHPSHLVGCRIQEDWVPIDQLCKCFRLHDPHPTDEEAVVDA